MWVLETRIEQLETDLEVLQELNESVDNAVRDKVEAVSYTHLTLPTILRV